MSGESVPVAQDGSHGRPRVRLPRFRVPEGLPQRTGRGPRVDRSELPRDTQDHWLDEVTADEDDSGGGLRRTLHSTIAQPAARVRRIASYVLTTPGRMISMTLVLAVAIFAAGYSMSQSSSARQDSLDELLSVTEPTSYAAHDLYTRLSLADTVTTSSLVSSGAQPAGELRAYHDAIAGASLAASEVAAGLPEDDHEAARLIATIQRELPVYTGLVETARANTRQGNPVGVSYAATASALLREQILPSAAALFDRTSQRVARAQAELTRPQFVPLSGLLAAVVFLVAAQWWLWRHTRRRFNRGFLVATAMMVLAILWVTASNVATWQAGSRGFDRAAGPWDALTTARIDAQQTRTAETLALVRRHPLDNDTDPFAATTQRIDSALDEVEQQSGRGSDATTDELVADARDALADWRAAHEKLIDRLAAGDFTASERMATATDRDDAGRPTTAGAFGELDRSLAELISRSRETMRSFLADGLAATNLVAAAVMLLSILSVAAVVIGIRPRFQEYL